jgi:hypothetical protein
LDRHKEYIAALDSLLDALKRSKCKDGLVILEALFPVLKEGKKHIHCTSIRASLNEYMTNLDSELLKAAFDLCFTHFMDKQYQEELRYELVEQLCLPLLSKMDVSLFIKIYEERIHTMMHILVNDSLQNEQDPYEIKTKLMEKTAIFQFLEV